MRYSISRKFFQVVILINFLTLSVVTIAIFLLTKGLQKEFLQQDYIEERDFILSEYDTSKPIEHRTNKILIEFIPIKAHDSLPQYHLFQNLSEGIGMKLVFENNTYLINIEKKSSGTFYHARDITQVIERERILFIVIIVIFIVTLLFSLVLSYSASQKIIQPLKYLSDYIASFNVGEKHTPIKTDFHDIELQNIALVFNEFLGELEQFLLRERSLVGLASHELKTPVAVISGAVEILKNKAELPSSLLGPLNRIENASNEMSVTIPILLELSRRSGQALALQTVDIKQVVDEVIQDLGQLFSVDSRVNLMNEDACTVESDKVLVKMLIQNIIQNALQHTAGEIDLFITPDAISICDRGNEEQSMQFKKLMTHTPTENKIFTNGLGLYIVTLISEQLNWSLDIASNLPNGSIVTVMFSPKQDNE